MSDYYDDLDDFDNEPICANCFDWQSDCCCDDPHFPDE